MQLPISLPGKAMIIAAIKQIESINPDDYITGAIELKEIGLRTLEWVPISDFDFYRKLRDCFVENINALDSIIANGTSTEEAAEEAKFLVNAFCKSQAMLLRMCLQPQMQP